MNEDGEQCPEIDRELRGLFDELEAVSNDHPELFDTDVRDSICVFMNYFVVWDHPLFDFPHDFGMFSPAGNDRVAQALRVFVERVGASACLRDVPVGQPRLDLLQRSAVRSQSGRSYDEFYGHRDTPLPRDERLFGMPK